MDESEVAEALSNINDLQSEYQQYGEMGVEEEEEVMEGQEEEEEEEEERKREVEEEDRKREVEEIEREKEAQSKAREKEEREARQEREAKVAGGWDPAWPLGVSGEATESEAPEKASKEEVETGKREEKYEEEGREVNTTSAGVPHADTPTKGGGGGTHTQREEKREIPILEVQESEQEEVERELAQNLQKALESKRENEEAGSGKRGTENECVGEDKDTKEMVLDALRKVRGVPAREETHEA